MPSASLNLSDLNGSNGFVIKDTNTASSLNLSVTNIGDINADGIADLSYGTNPLFYASTIKHIVFGGADIGAGGIIDVSTLNGSNGFVIKHTTAPSNTFISIRSIEDINADGILDLIVRTATPTSTPNYYLHNQYVVFGEAGMGAGGSIDLSTLNGINGFGFKDTNTPNPSSLLFTTTDDLNADGIADLIVSVTTGFFASAQSSRYVVFGGTNMAASASIDLANLNGTNGFRITSSAAHNLISSPESIGDINGDGIADFIVSTSSGYGSKPNYYAVFGGTDIGAGGNLDLANLDGSNGFVISSSDANISFRFPSLGDINGDGINDLMINRSTYDTPIPNPYVVFGGTDVGAGGSIDLANLDGSNGFRLNSGAANIGISSPKIVEDVNGDGIADFLVSTFGSFDRYDFRPGYYVVFGGTDIGAGGNLDLLNLDGSDGFAIIPVYTGEWIDFSVTSLGDINGDGFVDLNIEIYGRTPYHYYADGKDNYMVFGGTDIGAGGSIDLANLDGSNGFHLAGIFSNFRFSSVSLSEDMNGDGFDELIVSLYTGNPNGLERAGLMYVVFGGADIGAGGSIDLPNLDGSNGFVINGLNPGDSLGYSFTSTQDINADGINDLIISAPGADPNGINNAGSTYVVFGGTQMGAGGSIDLSNLNGSNGFVINGFVADKSSNSVKGLGDINSDGIDDVVIEGRPHTPNTPSYVIFGSTSFQFTPNAVNDQGITAINTPATLNVLANDSDSNGNPVQINTFNTTSTKGGTVTLNDNGTPTDLTDDQLVYTPPSDFIGFDSFTYTIDNTQGNRATATVDIKIFSQAGTPNADTLIAGNTGDWIRGAAGGDLITGGDGADQLLGNLGNDTLIGGLGNDALCGGWGNDVLTGGEGRDRFWLVPNRGTDTITDFEDNFDKLVLFNNLTFGQLSISRSNNNALISVTNTGEVLATLTGVQANLLTARDFISSNIAIG